MTGRFETASVSVRKRLLAWRGVHEYECVRSGTRTDTMYIMMCDRTDYRYSPYFDHAVIYTLFDCYLLIRPQSLIQISHCGFTYFNCASCISVARCALEHGGAY